MRVLHVVDSRQLRGGEIFAYELVRALNRAGISQYVAVLEDGKDSHVRYDAPERVLESNGPVIPALRINPTTVRGLRRLIRNWSPNVVQAHGGSSLKYVIPATMGQGAVVVYRQIGLAPPGLRGLRRAIHAQLLRRTSRVVAVADVVARTTTQLFRLPLGHVVTIPNAVNPERIRPVMGREATRRDIGIPSSAPVVLSLAALTWEKDPFTHLDVARRVLRENSQAVHVLVGDGPMRQGVDAAIRHPDLRNRVFVLGARADVADIIAASDVMLFASRPDGMEGMPASVIEAGIAGVPVVAFAVAGVPEIIDDGNTGYLVSPGDVNAMTASVLELLGNPQKRQAMGEAAREHCSARFNIRAIAPRYLELYEQLVTE